jgi:hypothetical protein
MEPGGDGMNYPLAELGEFLVYDGGRKLGVAIRCPHCGMRFSAWFKNPIGGGEPGGRVQWDRTGETLETLSLSPSFMFFGHCHSWIRDGQVCVDSQFSCQKIDPAHVV